MSNIGHNNAPKTILETIDDLYVEASVWLDGSGIEDDAQAVGLGKLIDMLKDARRTCEAERKAKAAPLDEAKRVVQAEYTPGLKKVDVALDAASTVRNRWLKARQAVIDEQARIAREEADKVLALAREAMRSSRGDLAAREAAEEMLHDAEHADIRARVLGKATPGSIGGRRTVSKKYAPVLIDGAVAAKHYWETRRADVEEYLTALAIADVRAGRRNIPGFNIIEEQE